MLNDIINKMKDYPSEFHFNEQKNTDIESFFKKELECQFVPREVLEFYKKYDGIDMAINEVLSLESIKIEYEDIDEFLEFMDMQDNTNDFIPIANDGMGGLYVFSSNNDDKKIYYLDHEYTDDIVEFDDFYSFLESEYNIAMEILKNEQ